MSAVYSDELKGMVQLYIDGDLLLAEKLMDALKPSSVATRFSLIRDVRGGKRENGSIFHMSAHNNDIEMLKCLLNRFSDDQLTEAWELSSNINGTRTVFHYAAYAGSAGAMFYLLERTAAENIVQFLITKDKWGDTALHDAAKQSHAEIIQVVLSFLSPLQQMKILKVKNGRNQSVAEMLCAKYAPGQEWFETFAAIGTLASAAVIYSKYDKIQGIANKKLEALEFQLVIQKADHDAELTAIKGKIEKSLPTSMKIYELKMDKKHAEIDGKQAEMDRKQAEIDRKLAELDRKQTEMDRKQAEMNRKQAEMDRKLSQLNIYLQQTICTSHVEDQVHVDADDLHPEIV